MRRELPGTIGPMTRKSPPNRVKNRGFEPILSHGTAVAPVVSERHAPDAETKVGALPEPVTATPREKPQN
jgi:hypothetical protein